MGVVVCLGCPVIPVKGTTGLVTIHVLNLIFYLKDEAKVRLAHRLAACHRLGFLTSAFSTTGLVSSEFLLLSRRTPRGWSSFFLVYFFI